MKIKVSQKHLEFLIKDLLSLSGGGTWHYTTKKDKFELLLDKNVNTKVVQATIYDWLKIRVGGPDDNKSN
jgi:hypothetical protein